VVRRQPGGSAAGSSAGGGSKLPLKIAVQIAMPITDCASWEDEQAWLGGLKQFTSAHARDHAISNVYGAETKAFFCQALITQVQQQALGTDCKGWSVSTVVEALRAIRILMRERVGPDPTSNSLVTNAAQGAIPSFPAPFGLSLSSFDFLTKVFTSAY
jgi:hypothetical protein